MKKTILFTVIFLLTFCSFTFAQTKIDRFCEVSIVPQNGFRGKTLSKISFGELDSLFFFKDNSIITNLEKVNSLKTSTDVLNYMSNLGWTLVNVIPFGPYTSSERLYFKKTFDLSDLGMQRN
jgi:hypothetical protein